MIGTKRRIRWNNIKKASKENLKKIKNDSDAQWLKTQQLENLY